MDERIIAGRFRLEQSLGGTMGEVYLATDVELGRRVVVKLLGRDAERERFERDLILRTLAEQQGNMSRTAEVLGVERSNLYRKMKNFGIAPSRRPEGEEEAV